MKKLIWNENDVLLDSGKGNGVYGFQKFTGEILFYGVHCKVKNADVIYNIKNADYLEATLPVNPQYKLCNTLSISNGEIESEDFFCTELNDTSFSGGRLNCKIFNHSIFNGKELFSNKIDNATIENGDIHCTSWRAGVFKNGTFNGVWTCGVFENGIFEDGDWKEGIFKKGIFYGNWYGGKWIDGNWNGTCFVGDGIKPY